MLSIFGLSQPHKYQVYRHNKVNIQHINIHNMYIFTATYMLYIYIYKIKHKHSFTSHKYFGGFT